MMRRNGETVPEGFGHKFSEELVRSVANEKIQFTESIHRVTDDAAFAVALSLSLSLLLFLSQSPVAK